MKRIVLTVGMYFIAFAAFGQSSALSDTAKYKPRPLKIEEINLISGYYQQDGNHSAVTAGNGTEQLSDIANTIELKLSKYGKTGLKHNLSLELGIDHYTSASSDKIDPNTISSASRSDTRIYPSLSYNIQNEKKKTTFGIIGSYSTEFDYTSYGTGLNFTKSSQNNNREFSIKTQAFFDTWKVIYPIELTPSGYGTGSGRSRLPLDYSPRNSFSASFSYSQVVSKRLQLVVIAEPLYQHGLLATKYQRVYFNDGTEKVENLPGSRYKLPLGIRLNYFLGDRTVIRTFYRYYIDNWGLVAHTISIETAIKLNPYISLSPFYRFYLQNGVSYFAPYAEHSINDKYYSSDYDLSKLNSQFLGLGVRLTPANGVLGIKHFSQIELRYGHYIRSTDLQANILTLSMKFK